MGYHIQSGGRWTGDFYVVDIEAALQAALDSPQGRTLLADLPNFAGDMHPIVAVEHLMLD